MARSQSGMTMTKPLILFFSATLFALLLDQGSKLWLLNVFDIQNHSPIDLTDFFSITMAWNPGVSFGLIAQDTQTGQWILAAFKVLAAIGLGFWAWKNNTRLGAIALGLIAGGALGNAIDRILYGAVADFFDFHIKTDTWAFQWYIFNIADVAIVAGVIALMYESFIVEGRASKSA